MSGIDVGVAGSVGVVLVRVMAAGLAAVLARTGRTSVGGALGGRSAVELFGPIGDAVR